MLRSVKPAPSTRTLASWGCSSTWESTWPAARRFGVRSPAAPLACPTGEAYKRMNACLVHKRFLVRIQAGALFVCPGSSKHPRFPNSHAPWKVPLNGRQLGSNPRAASGLGVRFVYLPLCHRRRLAWPPGCQPGSRRVRFSSMAFAAPAVMVQWQDATLPMSSPGFDPRSPQRRICACSSKAERLVSTQVMSVRFRSRALGRRAPRQKLTNQSSSVERLP